MRQNRYILGVINSNILDVSVVNNTESKTVIGGISGQNRQYLDLLNRHCKGPFKVSEAQDVLSLPSSKVIRLLSNFTEKSWLKRVKYGLYITVPLGTLQPSQHKEDPWIVAARVFEPCYIGGLSACEHWGLTEQTFKSVFVVTGKRIRARNQSIQGFNYQVRFVPKKKLFGIITEQWDQVEIPISSPSKTIADVLGDPAMGGGIRHIASMIGEYFRQNTRNDKELLSSLEKNGNRAAYKRLGYLVETLNIDSPLVVKTCRTNMSKGYSLLDTTVNIRDKIVRRWNIWRNVTIEAQEQY